MDAASLVTLHLYPPLTTSLQLLALIDPERVDLAWYGTDGPARCPNLPLRNFTALSKGLRALNTATTPNTTTTTQEGQAARLHIPEAVMRAAKAGELVACEFLLNALAAEYQRRLDAPAAASLGSEGGVSQMHLLPEIKDPALLEVVEPEYTLSEVCFRASVRWALRVALAQGAGSLSTMAREQVARALASLDTPEVGAC